ncbi:MAG TPA: hypothetical protein VMF13_23670, partial [Luteitalea sp.]|nr:hypothetical protein [Luteitalea sp.]
GEASLDIEIVSMTTRTSGDPRELGLRLEAVTIENQPLGARLGALLRLDAVVVAVAGACAWLVGAWVVGAAPMRRRWLAGLASWSAMALALGRGGVAVLAVPWVPAVTALLAVSTTWLFVRAGHRRATAVASGIVVGAQALVILSWCLSTFVDVPTFDLWEIVPLIEAQEARGFAWADLFASHNEHRPVMARAVILANIAVGHWNHWNELTVLLGTVAVHVVVYLAVVRRAAPERVTATVLAVTGVGTFIASATQWENLLHPWQMTAVIGATAVSAALAVLVWCKPSWPAWTGALMAMLVGTGAFASCLVAWPLGAFALAVRRGPQWHWRTAAWLLAATVVGVGYLHGLVRPAGLPPPARLFSSIDETLFVLQGMCIALAMPVWYTPLAIPQGQVVPWNHLPSIGVGAAALGVALTALKWRRAAGDPATWLWPALLMLFALGACLATAIGRVPLGLSAMTASRYIALTSLFWVGLVLLLTVFTPLRAAWARGASLGLAAIVIVLGLRGWVDGRPFLESDYIGTSLGRDALLRGDIAATTMLFPTPPVLDERQQVLRRRGLSLFRPGARD